MKDVQEQHVSKQPQISKYLKVVSVPKHQKEKVCQAAYTSVANNNNTLSITEGKRSMRLANELIFGVAVYGKVDSENVLPSSKTMQRKIIASGQSDKHKLVEEVKTELTENYMIGLRK